MEDEPRNWHSLHGKSISSLAMLAFFRDQVLCQCESWSMKKGKHWRIDALEMWCWRRLLRVTWTARRSNQSILKEVSPKHSLEGLLLKLKVQYLATWGKELTHWKRPWCWERVKAKGEGVAEDEMVIKHHWQNGHEFEQTQEIVEDRGAWYSTIHGVTKNQT